LVRVVKLELKGFTKRFGSLVANDHIDVVVEPGQIHCLLGENGAGKSTPMNVLYGLYEPSEGEILIDDEPVSFRGPGDATVAGLVGRSRPPAASGIPYVKG
jgi:general nucleoside transport system ATP-binding protein